MSNTTFALLGFLPDVETRLKELIGEGIAVPIKWVGATDVSLEGVVINANFLGSPQIQKYIQKVKARVVCCYRDVDGLQQSKLHNVPGLHLDGYTRSSDEAFREWLGYLSGRTEQMPVTKSDFDEKAYLSQQMQEIADFEPEKPTTTEQPVSQARPEPVASVTDTPITQATATAPVAEVAPQAEAPEQLPEIQQEVQSVSSSKSLSEDSQALLDKLKAPATYLYTESSNRKSWIDTNRKQVYIDYPRDSIPGVDTMQWSELEQLNVAELGSVRRVQLDLWLFETIWQSLLDGAGSITQSDYYKLSRWPRPLSASGRSEALRMAAFAQTVPVSVNELKEKTQYSEMDVRRFIFATLCAGQMRVATEAELPTAGNAKQSQRKPDKAKLGLLGRIRSKLGLS